MFRQMPEMRQMLENCYVDEDVTRAAKRFEGSAEFQATLQLVRVRGIKAPARVLDLGGGNGIASLAWHWAGFQVVLLEPDPSDIIGYGALHQLLENQPQGISICHAWAETIPFADGTFDVVYGRQIMHHVSDLTAVDREIHRVLRSGGIFFNAREHVLSKPEDLTIFLARHPVHRYTGGEHAYLEADYLQALRESGFTKIETLGSWESPINYFPETEADFRGRFRSLFVRFMGWKLAGLPAGILLLPPLREKTAHYLSQQDHTPGRMNTFIAVRS